TVRDDERGQQHRREHGDGHVAQPRGDGFRQPALRQCQYRQHARYKRDNRHPGDGQEDRPLIHVSTPSPTVAPITVAAITAHWSSPASSSLTDSTPVSTATPTWMRSLTCMSSSAM